VTLFWDVAGTTLIPILYVKNGNVVQLSRAGGVVT